MKSRLRVLGVLALMLSTVAAWSRAAAEPLCVSGRYPHLAMFNHGGECGIGAVVPWAGRLWAITYSPHMPKGSDDKLYEIDDQLTRIARPESVGGTPAGRLIHRESNQLIIGPYVIDEKRGVRAVSPKQMPGRLTAIARHLVDPANKVYVFDMEGMLYELDVRSLASQMLYNRPIPGWHGKGGYTGQGRFVLANNGEAAAAKGKWDYQVGGEAKDGEEAGCLAEWDGKTWRIVERRQFTDVTGPGGILGSPDDNAPVWAIGWDKRSLLLKVCSEKQWHTYRMPIADYSYVAAHGWHTEWPRIRQVTGGKFLMNLHGGWFDFPPALAPGKTARASQSSTGLRPVADYLKITADFCDWNGRIVFACDDTAKSGFSAAGVGDTLNRLNGQSCSNLWFTKWEALSQAGRPAGWGGVWLGDAVKANEPSAPYLLAGYAQRVLHLSHKGSQAVHFTIEIDKAGDGQWTAYRTIAVEAGGYAFHIFPPDLEGQWVRLKSDRDVLASAYFHYGPGGGATTDRNLFAALAGADAAGPWTRAVVRSEGEGRILLGVLASEVDASGQASPPRTYQVGPDMKFQPAQADSASAKFLQTDASVINRIIQIDDASVIVTEGKGRFRLPKGHPTAYDAQWAGAWPRALREVVTERSLLNAAGSFFCLPRTNSGGLPRLKPICTHNKRITDFCSWRGMLVLAGCSASAKSDGHYFAASRGKVGLWFGDIDDLWKMGKPRGVGGPWKATPVEAGKASDPYLMAGYDKKTLELSQDSAQPVTFKVEVEITGQDFWRPYKTIEVPAGQTVTHEFPEGFSAHWVRLRASQACQATATLRYE